jgi:serine protein kinase
MVFYDGDWKKVMEHVASAASCCRRRTASASAPSSPRTRRTRTRPSSPATSTIARSPMYGSDSDPRAFNFDGELNIANRGVCEFIEVLKLDVAFLYDSARRLAGARHQAQEVRTDPHRRGDHRAHQRARVQALQSNEMMEAFRDRTIKIDVPYNIRPRRRDQDLREGLRPAAHQGVHIAPHTLEVAAMWAVLTRLESPRRPDSR